MKKPVSARRARDIAITKRWATLSGALDLTALAEVDL